MKVVFRVDASRQIGTGHVMRCLTLSRELSKHCVDVHFICRKHEGNLGEKILDNGFNLHYLPENQSEEMVSENDSQYGLWLGTTQSSDALETNLVLEKISNSCVSNKGIDWLVVDHYALDIEWERRVKCHVKNIFVIDDLAIRQHECDVLLDQNYYKNLNHRYDDLVNDDCKLLLGPKYAMLREEFSNFKIKKIKAEGLCRIAVFYGGIDDVNETTKAINALLTFLDDGLEVDVIVGKGNPHANHVRQLCESHMNLHFFQDIKNMAERLCAVDVVFCAGGATTWERCAVGVPGVVTSVAENQVVLAETLDDIGAQIYLGASEHTTIESYQNVVKQLLIQPNSLLGMREKSHELVDGLGVERVCFTIIGH